MRTWALRTMWTYKRNCQPATAMLSVAAACNGFLFAAIGEVDTTGPSICCAGMLVFPKGVSKNLDAAKLCPATPLTVNGPWPSAGLATVLAHLSPPMRSSVAAAFSATERHSGSATSFLTYEVKVRVSGK